jgi:hypothetical protein
VTHIWVTLSDLFTQFTIKWTQRMAWKKNAWNKKELDKKLRDWLFFIYIIFNTFLK